MQKQPNQSIFFQSYGDIYMSGWLDGVQQTSLTCFWFFMLKLKFISAILKKSKMLRQPQILAHTLMYSKKCHYFVPTLSGQVSLPIASFME